MNSQRRIYCWLATVGVGCVIALVGSMATTIAQDSITGCVAMEAYIPTGDGKAEQGVLVVNADGSGLTQVDLNMHLWMIKPPVWSPTGTHVAFVGYEGTEHGSLFLMQADGTNVIRVTQGDTRYPVWSPDGEYLAFWQRGHLNIIAVTAPAMSVYYSSMEVTWFAWSPDGRYLFVETNGSEHYLMDGSNFEILQVLNARLFGYRFAWSPDSQQLAIEWREDRHDHLDIYVLDVDSSEITRVTGTAEQDRSPVWSADGRWITFRSGPDNQTYLTDQYGTIRLHLAHGSTSIDTMIWSPVGDRLAVRAKSEDGRLAVFLVPLDGGEWQQVSPTDVMPPIWSPDGSKLLISTVYHATEMTFPDPPAALFVYDLDTETQQEIAVYYPLDSENRVPPIWLPDSQRIAFFGVVTDNNRRTVHLNVIDTRSAENSVISEFPAYAIEATWFLGDENCIQPEN